MPESSNTGGRKPRVTDADLLDVFQATSDPVLSTAEVADRVPIKRRGVLNRLRDLEGRGALASKQIGGRNTVWWRPDDAGDESGREAVETTPGGRADRSSSPDTGAQAGGETAPGDAARDDVGDVPQEGLADAVRAHLEATGQPPKTAHGRGVILDVFRLLRERGTMSTGDLQDEIYSDYTDHWGSGRTMWNAIDRYLEDIPGIEKGGYGEWAYAGDDAVREALEDSDGDPLDGEVYDPTEEF